MIVGTRGSKLALAQTALFVEAIKKKFPNLDIEIKKIVTAGDRIKDRPLSEIGGYGAFVKELDKQIIDGKIDAAVNSLKDMPAKLTPGTCIAAVMKRGPVEDVIIPAVPLEKLPSGAVVGTSSVRRKALLLNKRSDLIVKDLRGNVTTRLRKLQAGEFDAIIMARAGLERIGFGESFLPLDPWDFVPAVGQGAIAVVCKEDSQYREMLSAIEDSVTRMETETERLILKELGGGCSIPLGLWAKIEGSSIKVRGIVLSDYGKVLAQVAKEVKLGAIHESITEIVRELKRGMEGAVDDCKKR
ncbi:MAG: hydroxymethylbilane synthase [Methanomassiliicoccales archaeon]